jgi:hypothetical protein
MACEGFSAQVAENHVLATRWFLRAGFCELKLPLLPLLWHSFLGVGVAENTVQYQRVIGHCHSCHSFLYREYCSFKRRAGQKWGKGWKEEWQGVAGVAAAQKSTVFRHFFCHSSAPLDNTGQLAKINDQGATRK